MKLILRSPTKGDVLVLGLIERARVLVPAYPMVPLTEGKDGPLPL